MKKNDSNVMDRIETLLDGLNRKLDILIRQSSQNSPERSSVSDRGFDDRARRMQYKAVCAECGKTCSVPFKPSGGRPVFCSDCFSKQQDQGGEESRFHKSPKSFRKSPGGKKPFFKKR